MLTCQTGKVPRLVGISMTREIGALGGSVWPLPLWQLLNEICDVLLLLAECEEFHMLRRVNAHSNLCFPRESVCGVEGLSSGIAFSACTVRFSLDLRLP